MKPHQRTFLRFLLWLLVIECEAWVALSRTSLWISLGTVSAFWVMCLTSKPYRALLDKVNGARRRIERVRR